MGFTLTQKTVPNLLFVGMTECGEICLIVPQEPFSMTDFPNATILGIYRKIMSVISPNPEFEIKICRAYFCLFNSSKSSSLLTEIFVHSDQFVNFSCILCSVNQILKLRIFALHFDNF